MFDFYREKFVYNNRVSADSSSRYRTMHSICLTIVLSVLLLQPITVEAKRYQVDTYYQPVQSSAKYGETAKNLIKRLYKLHYRHLVPNDRLSSLVFDKLLDDMDPRKLFFIKSDIEEFEAYR